MATEHTLFTDLLTALRVPHTDEYSRSRFASMPFNTLFGLSKLLAEYGVQGAAYRLPDGADLSQVPTPYLLQTNGGFVIVTDIAPDGTADYLTRGVRETIPLAELNKASAGVAFIPDKTPSGSEPDYRSHRLVEIARKGKSWMLTIGLSFLLVWYFIFHGIYTDASAILLMLFSLGGLTLSVLLMQKSIGMTNAHADRFCGVLEKGGCDEVLKMKASSFFGIVSWSDVGVAYFGVTLVVLMLAPWMTPYLAIYNACCLPFTCWSIWYQKFRARHWCTLCVCVQATLWCLFICFLAGGWFGRLTHIGADFYILGVGYVTILLLISKITDSVKKLISK